MPPLQHLLGERVVGVVVVGEQLAEQRLDTPPGLADEQVGQLDRLVAALGVLLAQRLRVPTPDTQSGDELDGEPAAALSLKTNVAIADPFQPTEELRVYLRMRASALEAVEREPSLRERMLDAVRRPVLAA